MYVWCMAYSVGVDFGTNSCRAIVVRLADGVELGSEVFGYPSGEMGILLDAGDAHVARQEPQDYVDGLVATVRGALVKAGAADGDFSADAVVGLGIDTTGSTVIPVDGDGVPLAFDTRFRDRLSAKVWLWRDHTAHVEAERITELAGEMRPEFLEFCGGRYSSEWFWAKIWRLLKDDREVFEAAGSFVEHCDWLPALITGNARKPRRGVCAAGHKAMYNARWGGLPDVEFLGVLDPRLGELRGRLFDEVFCADEAAGELTGEWAERLGLPEGMVVAVGAFDAHMGAVGAGVREGVLAKVMGTSTCDIMVSGKGKDPGAIEGVCGVVDGSVLPGCVGIEAGQSAVGDLFLWLERELVPAGYGVGIGERFSMLGEEIAGLGAGECGLLALDWNNGNRTILVDQQLSGLLVGQTLQTTAAEVYRAYIEATAFGALRIIDRIEESGVRVEKVVCTGGLSLKNETLMQVYADVLNRRIEVSAVEQTCAMGAAMFGAFASGRSGYGSLEGMQDVFCRMLPRVYEPEGDAVGIYGELYGLYCELHDAFGTREWRGNLFGVMKMLLEIKGRVKL